MLWECAWHAILIKGGTVRIFYRSLLCKSYLRSKLGRATSVYMLHPGAASVVVLACTGCCWRSLSA
jgi:hypothetical protein